MVVSDPAAAVPVLHDLPERLLRQVDFIVVAIVATLVAAVAVWALLPFLRRFVIDQPRAWKSHLHPTPRGGGLGIALGVAAGYAVAAAQNLALARPDVLLAAVVMCTIGMIDDFAGHLRVSIRLGVQTAAAAWVATAVGGLDGMPLPPPLDVPLGHFAIPVAIVWIVGVTNLYNFLDGIDGLAASQGVVAGVALALLPWDLSLRVTGMAVGGACLGFLFFNWEPAKVFMGDVGSASAGFLLACMPFHPVPEVREEAMVVAAFTLWFFLCDGSFTLAKRVLKGEAFWRPHRSHLYQRLVATGVSHAWVTVLVAGTDLVFALMAVFMARRVEWSPRWWILFVLGGLAFAAYLGLVRYREARVSPAEG